MRRRYVSVPYQLEPEDVPAATELIRSALPVIFEALSIDYGSRLKIQALLRSDLIYLEPLLWEPVTQRPAMTVSGLVKGANIARSNFYAHCGALATKVQRCALALTMLLAARGDFCDANMWMVCEIDSPVGRGSTGPGRVGTRQRLWGIALAGGDVMLPVILTAPAVGMDETKLLDQLEHMLRDVSLVADRLRLYAASLPAGDVAGLGMTAQDLLTYAAMTTILVPQLHLRPDDASRWLGPIPLGPEVAKILVSKHDFRRSVVEVDEGDDTPYSSPHEWKLLSWKSTLDLAAYVALTDLDLGFKPSSVSYYVRRDGTILHRRQHPTSAEGMHAIANDMSFAVSGFNLREIEDMGSAIACIEFLATKTHIKECGARCADQMTPSLLKAHADDQQALAFALRTTLNSALISVGRGRQARGLDDSVVR